MNNLTPIKVTYNLGYGTVEQERTFITRPHFNSLKALTKPLEEDIKNLLSTIKENTPKEIIKQTRDAVGKLESEIKKIIPPYTFIVEDSQVGSAILSVSEGMDSDLVIIPYHDKPTYKVRYRLL